MLKSPNKTKTKTAKVSVLWGGETGLQQHL